MGCLLWKLWDLIVSVLGNVSRVSDGSVQPDSDVHKRHKPHKKIDVMKDIDSVPSNVQSARQEALLYVFEDNEAVIKMIIKGRSPTMRRVSRTHRVALDWLFGRTNLDSKIQIKYIDTKNQLADILTRGNFTRDEWNHLLNFFNISHFSSTACTAAIWWKHSWTTQRTSNSVWCNGWVFSYFLRGASQGSTNSVRTFYLKYSSDLCWSRERIREGDIMVAEIEELENLDESEIHARRLNAKEVSTSKKGRTLFPIADGTARTVWKRSWSPRTHSKTGSTCNERRSQGGVTDQWKETSLIVITSNLEFDSSCRKKKHSQYHWNTSTWPNLRTQILMWCRKSVLMTVRTSTWTTKFTLLNEKPPLGYMWSGERLRKVQATTRPDDLWPEIWSNMSKAAQKK